MTKMMMMMLTVIAYCSNDNSYSVVQLEKRWIARNWAKAPNLDLSFLTIVKRLIKLIEKYVVRLKARTPVK